MKWIIFASYLKNSYEITSTTDLSLIHRDVLNVDFSGAKIYVTVFGVAATVA